MYKKLLIFLFVILAVGMFTGCEGKTLPSDLYIDATDIENAPAGEYYIPYSVNKFSDYEVKYDLSVAVNVYLLPSNKPITVKNNRTITVEKENSYTVVIRLYGTIDGEAVSLDKTFTIKAEKADRVVTFAHENGDEVKRFVVKYGGSLNYEEIPELPDRYTVSDEGYYTRIVSKRWVVYTADGEKLDLKPEYLTDITENIPVYSEYVYAHEPINYTIRFNSDGGTEIPDYLGNTGDVPLKPNNPEKEGYTFIGWCTDKERTEFYNWKNNQKLKNNMELYAKWVKNTQNPTPDNVFNFYESEDDYGNAFYIIEGKDKENIVGNLVLPNNYRGLPIRRMSEKAFYGTAITSVTIPNCYVLDSKQGFASCKNLVSVEFEEGSVTHTIASEFFFECTALNSINLPNGITLIRQGAFTNCLALKDIKLPSSLRYINSRAFAGCQLLESIVLPDETLEINDEAFINCSKLKKIEIGEDGKISAFGKDVFKKTQIEEITLPYRLGLDKNNPPLKDEGIVVKYYPEKEKGE